MCGILFYSHPLLNRDDDRVTRALRHMHVRGPDWHDLCWGEGYVMGHTRLSIIDLSPQARQPFWDASGRYLISYNGEIYNHEELRHRLERAGRVFRTKSDTEVLLEALLHFGWKKALSHVRGMFAFVLLDTATGRILAARDHFGQKPVYYVHRGQEFGVASSPSSLLELLDRRSPNLAAYSVYLSAPGESGTRGVTQADRTFFEGVHALPAGHAIIVEGGDVLLERYFAPVELYDPKVAAEYRSRSKDGLIDDLRGLFRQAMRRHLVSDVPVGMLLSGGIDSSLVYWFASEHSDRLSIFTKISPGIEEIPLNVVPSLLRLRPSDAHFSVQSPESYLSELQQFIKASASPSRWGGGPPMNKLCTEARRNGVFVLLGGDCADEYFGGYEHYKSLISAGDVENLGELVTLDPQSPFYRAGDAADFEAQQRQIRAEIWSALADENELRDRYAQATLLHDTTTFLQTCNLPHSDAYSMMSSVELRNPLLDKDLVKFAINLPPALKANGHESGFYGKVLMRMLAGRDIGDFVQTRKEGTRNFAMRVAEPSYWNFENFALRDILQIPDVLTKRQTIRLFNLEIFHRMFFDGDEEICPKIMTGDGLQYACLAA